MVFLGSLEQGTAENVGKIIGGAQGCSRNELILRRGRPLSVPVIDGKIVRRAQEKFRRAYEADLDGPREIYAWQSAS